MVKVAIIAWDVTPYHQVLLNSRQVCEEAGHLRAQTATTKAETRRMREKLAEAPWHAAARQRLRQQAVAVITQTEADLALLQHRFEAQQKKPQARMQKRVRGFRQTLHCSDSSRNYSNDGRGRPTPMAG